MTETGITIVVKFVDAKKIQHAAADPIPESHTQRWKALAESLARDTGGTLIARGVFNAVALRDIETLKTIARAKSEAAHLKYSPPKFENYVSLVYMAVAEDDDKRDEELAFAVERIVKDVTAWADVEQCYCRPRDVDPSLKATTRPVTFGAPDSDPAHAKQQHLLDAPLGVGVQSLWNFEGADGAGQRFIDIERGWQLEHPDLSDVNGQPRVQLIPSGGVISKDAENIWHGTCVLGIVCAAHNGIDVIGMAPRLEAMEVLSYVDPELIHSSASAVMLAAAQQIKRDVTHLRDTRRPRASTPTVRSNVVLLIEAQAQPWRQRFYFPVEIYPDTFDAIALATHAGITVIEPAGNGRLSSAVVGPQDPSAVDLDRLNKFFKPALNWKLPPKSLARTERATVATEPRPSRVENELLAFVDSGAVMVACAEHQAASGEAWKRSSASNFGSRIDCFASGSTVRTLDAGAGAGPEFSGTSSAAAIIAGAALSLQGLVHAHLGRPLDPATLRSALSDETCGTVSLDARTQLIGVMPDLMAIAKKYVDGQ